MMSNVDENWPDPPAEAAFHGLAGEIIRVIEPHTEADPAALLVQLLTGFGNAIGRKPHFVVEADRHGMNLFTVLVGVTGKARKGSSWGHIKRLFESFDPIWASEQHVTTGLSSGEGLIWAVRDPSIEDKGISDKRLLVLEPEFASTLRVMGRDGSTLSPVVRRAWDSGNLRSLTKNSPVQATGAYISVIGHITRDELLRRLDDIEMANGFGNRFLWVCVKRSKFLPEGGQLEQGTLNPLIERLKEAVRFAEEAEQMMTRNDEARQLWRQVYPKLSSGCIGLVGAITSRAEAQVTRLSCLYALLDRSYVVNDAHLRAALSLWDYCDASARYIFKDKTGDPVADDIQRALIGNPEGLTRTQIRDLFQRNKERIEISRALGLLTESGLVKMKREETDGRPVERWFAADKPDTT